MSHSSAASTQSVWTYTEKLSATDTSQITTEHSISNDAQKFYDNLEENVKIKILVLASLGVGAVLTNGLLIATILSYRKLRTASNTFVVALATSDFCLGLFNIPLHCLAESGLLGR